MREEKYRIYLRRMQKWRCATQKKERQPFVGKAKCDFKQDDNNKKTIHNNNDTLLIFRKTERQKELYELMIVEKAEHFKRDLIGLHR